MEQQRVVGDAKTYFQKMKMQMDHLRADAKAVLGAIKNDSAAVRKTIATLRDKSEIRSFVKDWNQAAAPKKERLSRQKTQPASKKIVTTRKKAAAPETGRHAAH
jgi:hypothetical protein